MSRFIPPTWWPACVVLAPVALPAIALGGIRFGRNRERAEAANRARLAGAKPLDLAPVRDLELVVLVDWRAEDGYRGGAGVSYLLRTELGSVLFDVGFGPTTPTLEHNVRRLGLDLHAIDALAISHLHLDHIGGAWAQRRRRVRLPPGLVEPRGRPLYLPDSCEAPGWNTRVVSEPGLLAAGIATPGPLARAIYFMGCTEELPLVVNLEGLGLVVVTGCGHPGLPAILAHAERVFRRPIHTVVGGLHLPLTAGRGYGGLPVQRVVGTGLPPWRMLDDRDLDEVVQALRCHRVQRLLLSAHDSCDVALSTLASRSGVPTEIVSAGRTYRLAPLTMRLETTTEARTVG